MITEDQHEVIAFLASPAQHDGSTVERIDTHGAVVFLAGDRVLKLKRAVRFDYMDASTADRRRALCEAEVRVNRRTAPRIYHGVSAVTREGDGSLALGGTGAPVDWVVVMSRFNESEVLDRRAEAGALDITMMEPLAHAIAALHASARVRPDHGGRAGMRWVIEGNAAGFANEGGGVLDPELGARVIDASRRLLDEQSNLLDQRREAGFVRECHGDLHLRNIVSVDGVPTLFDAIEFNDEIACVDVFYDLAFLLMDLWHRGLRTHGNVVLNSYLGDTGDLAGVGLLRLFLSCRAAVRAKVLATSARVQPEEASREALERSANEYLVLADRALHPRAPRLVAVGGLSGTGKTTLARGLAPSIGPLPGAVLLRSDELRKQLSGVRMLERLGADSYTAEVSRRVYATLMERAAAVVGRGHAVILDAVFSTPDERAAAESIARAAGVPFVGLWLDAPDSVLLERVALRQADASDADVAVVQRQLQAGVGAVSWARIAADADATTVLTRAARHVRTSAT